MMNETKVPRSRDLSHVSICPKDFCNVTLQFYGDEAAAIFELQEINGTMSKSEICHRLAVLGLQSLGYCFEDEEVPGDE